MHQAIDFIKKTLFTLLMLAITISVACAEESATKVTAQKEGTVKTIVARVNGKEISSTYLGHFVKAVIAKQPNAQLPPETLKKIRANVLDKLISMELLYQAGQKQKVEGLDKLVNDTVTQLKKGLSDDPFFQKSLIESMTESELRKCVREHIVISNFIDSSIVPKISVSDEEIKRFYDQNIERFTRDEQVRLNQIVIGTSKTMSDDERKNARELAERLHEDILKGADFAKLAKENSTIKTRIFGGDTGYMTRKQLEPTIAQMAFSFKVGQLSDVVETPFGFQIIRLRDRKKAETMPFNDAKDGIKDYLIDQRKEPAILDYLTTIRKNADIVITPN